MRVATGSATKALGDPEHTVQAGRCAALVCSVWRIHCQWHALSVARLTFSFSCVSRIVFPSAFFLQLCPSRRKKRVAFRLNRNRVPPAQGHKAQASA